MDKNLGYMLVSVAIGIVGFILSTLFAIVAYFLRKAQDDQEKRLIKIEQNQELFRDKLLPVAEVARLVEEFAELEKRLSDISRSSVTDELGTKAELQRQFQAEIKEIEQKAAATSRELADLKLAVATWQSAAAERFVPRADFIRDSTTLDSKISGVHRSIKSMEETVDGALRRYLGK